MTVSAHSAYLQALVRLLGLSSSICEEVLTSDHKPVRVVLSLAPINAPILELNRPGGWPIFTITNLRAQSA
jgi:hypothetical protein